MSRYRQRPVEIEAFWLTHNPMLWGSIQPAWFTSALESGQAWYQGGDHPYYTIKTIEGEMRANPGDYIIRGVEGEIYPCKSSIFNATYEPAESEE